MIVERRMVAVMMERDTYAEHWAAIIASAPDCARLVGVDTLDCGTQIVLCFSHPGFAPVERGCPVPRIVPYVREGRLVVDWR